MKLYNRQSQGADRVQKYRPRTGELQDTITFTGTLSQLPERQFYDAGSGSEAGYLSDFSKKSDVNIHWNRTTRSTMKAPRPLYIKRFQRLTNINKT